MELSQENVVLILAALLAISEVLALIPGIKSNSIFTLIFSILKKAKEVLGPKPTGLLK